MLAPWKARQEAQAKQIAAKGIAESQRILAEGQAKTLDTIVSAQAQAREKMRATGVDVRGELSIGDMVSQRVQFQEEKRQANIVAVTDFAASHLGDAEVPDSEPDHDWTAQFFNYVQDVSSEEMQALWGKVLAGEVERPGSTSIRTLSILRNLDQSTAGLFTRLSSVCVSISFNGNQLIDARVPSLGGDAGQNALQEYGLQFDKLNVLNEYGLIISDYNSRYDYKLCIGIPMPGPTPRFVRIPFGFQGQYWVLVPTGQHKDEQEFRLSGVALTKAGRELSTIVDLEPVNDYFQALMEYFKKSGLQMTEVDSG